MPLNNKEEHNVHHPGCTKPFKEPQQPFQQHCTSCF